MHAPDPLLQRILAYDFDGGEPVAYPFARKLARQAGWSDEYAARAILEYKRYMYLAATRETPVCPSEPVDKVWHQHLTYTRSYWQDFCKGVLGTEVHHEPSTGGGAEDAKHWEMYEATLDAYRQAFGAEPPDDIWPPVEARFSGMKLQPAAVWGPGRIALAAAAAAVGLMLISSHLGSTDPFQLEGIRFLGVLIPAMIAASFIGQLLKTYVANAAIRAKLSPSSLDWADAAYLAGGPSRLTLATVAHLVGRKAVRVDPAAEALVPGERTPAAASPVERAVLRSLPLTPKDLEPGSRARSLEAATAAAYEPRAGELLRQSLLIGEEAAAAAKRWSVLPMAAVLLGLGLPRLLNGLDRGKPVFFLAIIMIAGLVICAVNFMRPRHKPASVYGLAALKQLRTDMKNRPATAATIGLAVGLAGASALADTSMNEIMQLRTFMPKQTSDSSSSSDSGSSGGGDSGGGSGCGGCGGGGGD